MSGLMIVHAGKELFLTFGPRSTRVREGEVIPLKAIEWLIYDDYRERQLKMVVDAEKEFAEFQSQGEMG